MVSRHFVTKIIVRAAESFTFCLTFFSGLDILQYRLRRRKDGFTALHHYCSKARDRHGSSGLGSRKAGSLAMTTPQIICDRVLTRKSRLFSVLVLS